MKRLLIVDDEHHIVNWLADLFEKQRDLELIVMKAYTGKEALHTLERTKIDVILLDIKMPGIDGLEVSERILTDWPGCRIIFLTGYSHFDYVYYANTHKNISFLLKTECDETIIRTVEEAICSIEKENKLLELSMRAEAKEKMINVLFERDFYREFLRGSDVSDIKNRMEVVGKHLDLRPTESVIMLYGKIFSAAGDSGYDNFSKFTAKSMYVVEQILNHKFHYALVDYDESTIVFFLQPVNEFTEKSKLDPILYIKESFDDIIASFQEHLSGEIMLLLYHRAIAWENIYDTFLLLNQFALEQSQWQACSYGKVYKESDESCITRRKSDNLKLNKWNTQLGEITAYLNQGEHKQLTFLIKQLAFFCKDIKSMHDLSVIGLYMQISSMLIQYINKYELSERLAPRIGLYPLYYIHNFENWREAFGYLEKLVNIMFELNYGGLQDKNQRLVTHIKEYIHAHLQENLNLSALSDVVNYNSTYVSRIFKQTTGMNLSDYVTACRINKAKELLHNSSTSIHSISEKVGFDTCQYFCMVFRKEVGITPSEYRKQK